MISTNAAVAMKKGSGVMPSADNRIYTIDDIEGLPEGERAELIDGKIYYMSSPKYIHQKLLVELSAEIHNYIKSKGGSCEVLLAPFAVFVNKDRHNYVEPDISVICDKFAQNSSASVRAEMLQAFIRSVQFEEDFFNHAVQ